MRRLLILPVLVAALLHPASALALNGPCQPVGQNPGATSWTNGAGGQFNDPNNWSNGSPSASCSAAITLAGTYTVTDLDGGGTAGLTLGGTSGTQTLSVAGSTGNVDSVLSAGNVAIAANGVLQMTAVGSTPGRSIIGASIVNSGLIRVDAGTGGGRDLRSAITNTPAGTIAIHTDLGTCSCGGDHTWINNGTMTTDAGTTSYLSATGAGVPFTQSAGTLTNNGELIVDGSFTHTGGATTGNPIQVCGGVSAPGPGTASIDIIKRSAYCGGGSITSATIGAGDTVRLRNSETGQLLVSAASFTNKGTLSFGGTGTGDRYITGGPTITNQGTLAFTAGGRSELQGKIVNSGTITVAPAAPVDINGTFDQSAGSFSVGGTATMHSPMTLTGGTIANAGTVKAGDFTHAGGSTSGAPITICGGSLKPTGPGTAAFKLTNDGCSSSSIDSDIGPNDSVSIAASGGTFDVFTGTITNHGSLTTDSSAGLVQLHGPVLTNQGTLSLTGGTTNVALELDNTGTMTVPAGATVNSNAQIKQAGGTVTVDGSLNTSNAFTLSGGSISNAGTLTAFGNLSHSGGSASGNPIEVCGALSAAGPGTASFRITRTDTCGGSLTSDIGAGDTVVLHTTTLTQDIFLGTVINHGTLRTEPGSDQPVQLHGTLLTNLGTLQFGPGTTNLGVGVEQAGGTLTVGGTVNSPSSLPITGGIVTGTGTLGASDGVSNTGGTVHPGHSLAIAGSYTQGAGGTLAVDVTDPGFGQLAVTGAADLAGALDVSTPTPLTGTFRILTAGTRAGTFSTVTSPGEPFTVAYDATGVDLSGTAPTATPTASATAAPTTTAAPTAAPTASPTPSPSPTPADHTAPAITKAHATRKKVTFNLSEAAKVRVTIKHVKAFTVSAKRGANTVKFKGRVKKAKLRHGRLRVTLVATDAAGNRSAPRRLRVG